MTRSSRPPYPSGDHGDNSDDSTRIIGRVDDQPPVPRNQRPQQYYRPLSDAERGYPSEDYSSFISPETTAYDDGVGYRAGYPVQSSPVAPPRAYSPEPPPQKRSSHWGWVAALIAALIILGGAGIVAAGLGLFAWDTSTDAAPSETVVTVTSTVEPSTESTVGDRLSKATEELRDSVSEISSEVAAPELAGLSDVVDKPAAIATATLLAHGYSDITYLTESGEEVSLADIVTATVIRMDPPAGSDIARDTPIILTVR